MITFTRARSDPGPTAEIACLIAEAREEVSRTDGKAGTLLTLATGALAGLLTLTHTRIPLPVAITLWLAASLVTAALAVLLAVVRPSLPAIRHGGIFPGAANLLAAAPGADLRSWQESRLRTFSALAAAKHRKVRLAVDLLGLALAVLVIAVVLAAGA